MAPQLPHLWNGDSCISPVSSALLDVTIAAAPNSGMNLPDTFCCCPMCLFFRSYPLAAHLCPTSWLPQSTTPWGVPVTVFPWPHWLIWLQADAFILPLFETTHSLAWGQASLGLHDVPRAVEGLGDPSCKLLHTVFFRTSVCSAIKITNPYMGFVGAGLEGAECEPKKSSSSKIERP